MSNTERPYDFTARSRDVAARAANIAYRRGDRYGEIAFRVRTGTFPPVPYPDPRDDLPTGDNGPYRFRDANAVTGGTRVA